MPSQREQHCPVFEAGFLKTIRSKEDVMRLAFGCLALVALLVGTNSSSRVRAADEKVAIDKLPKAVTEAVAKRFPEAKLLSAEKESADGKTVYDVALKNKNQNIEVTVTPEGKIDSYEIEIAAKDMSRAAIATLEAKYPKATYTKVEEVYKVKDGKEKMEEYEVLLMTADKKVEVLVTPEGRITKTSEEKPKEEKK
jgi:hypothetical protein